MTDFTFSIDAEGVATIVWDVPNKSMNVLSLEGVAELNGLIDKALSDQTVKVSSSPLAKKTSPEAWICAPFKFF